MKPALGTVQLGLAYGAHQEHGVMPKEIAFDILEEALSQKLEFFDTAIAYGLSEERLGAFDLSQKSPSSLISTKIPAAPPSLWGNEQSYWDWLCQQLEESKVRLKIERHDLLQFHQCDLDFLNAAVVQRNLENLLSKGLCRRIGVSVYQPAQGISAIKTGLVHAVQVPANLVDTRFLKGEFQALARSHKILLIGRSALLQGVLVPGTPIPSVRKAKELTNLRAELEKLIGAAHLHRAAISFLKVNHKESLDYLLFGVDSVQSLRQNLQLFNDAVEPLAPEIVEGLCAIEQNASAFSLENPATWNL